MREEVALKINLPESRVQVRRVTIHNATVILHQSYLFPLLCCQNSKTTDFAYILLAKIIISERVSLHAAKQ